MKHNSQWFPAKYLKNVRDKENFTCKITKKITKKNIQPQQEKWCIIPNKFNSSFRDLHGDANCWLTSDEQNDLFCSLQSLQSVTHYSSFTDGGINRGVRVFLFCHHHIITKSHLLIDNNKVLNPSTDITNLWNAMRASMTQGLRYCPVRTEVTWSQRQSL